MSGYKASSATSGYEFSVGSGYALPQYEFVAPPELLTQQTMTHEVVILGAGLTGLTLAALLGRYGVKTVVIDEDNTVGVKGASSRGICYTQKSLEIFDRIGIYDRILKKGIQWSVGRTFAGNDEVYSFDLKAQSQFNLSEQPAFINIQQFYNEGFLAEAAINTGMVDIRWLTRLESLETTAGLARLHCSTPQGNYSTQARYIVDATGANSRVRKASGVGVKAKKGDDRWCIADVRFKAAPPTERHTWIEAPFNDNRAVWQHKMADEVWRIDYQMAPDADAAYVSREDVVRERLAKQFGSSDDIELVWVGPYAYRSELVDSMMLPIGKSKLFFAGDSAKVVSPFGARGGNTGISDADNLAWKLAAVVTGKATPKLLDSYHSERHEASTTNVQVTNRTARFLRPADGFERLMRTAVLDLATDHAFARPLVNTGRMAVANRYSQSPVCGNAGGVSVQNASFKWADGQTGHLHDLLRWCKSDLLLLLWVDSRAELNAWVKTKPAHVRAVLVCTSASQAVAREHLIDKNSQLRQACGVKDKHLTWALIRPDAYLAESGLDLSEVARAAAQAWGNA